uniref:RNA helicase n=1 Tax=Timema monikensis TaxID=170555 RepID=A0A7R9E294_9NEOP|nr:unnamed protein product [Timema monikensis]
MDSKYNITVGQTFGKHKLNAPKNVVFTGSPVLKKAKLEHQNLNTSSPSVFHQRKLLPVFGVRNKLLAEIHKYSSLIVIGETGSGKTTQIPQFMHEVKLDRDGMIGVTQPRRVAAMTISQRVAQEMNTTLGELVGYSVRFEDVTSKCTKLKYLTDGMLLREALLDPLLLSYSVIVLDEAHERTVHTDILFGVVKQAQKFRTERSLKPLKILVMSATMDVDHFSHYFGNIPVVYLEGRQYPVQVFHAIKTQEDYAFSCLVTIFQIHKDAPPNWDILVFLTGQEEIEAMAYNIRLISKLLYLFFALAPTTPTTLSTAWTAPQFMFSEPSIQFPTVLSAHENSSFYWLAWRPLSFTFSLANENSHFFPLDKTMQQLRVFNTVVPRPLSYPPSSYLPPRLMLPGHPSVPPRLTLRGHTCRDFSHTYPHVSEHYVAVVATSTSYPQSRKQGIADLEGKCVPLKVYPLYSSLPSHMQLDVFRPTAPGMRKVILSTNIAETSVTISGIKYIIDSGMVKNRSHHPGTGLDVLKVQRISQAQAWQRTGRAGRESPGFCYRTYTHQYVDGAIEQLKQLGAIESTVSPKLTATGHLMAQFPLDPRYSKIIISAKDYNCVQEILTIVAMLSGESVFVNPPAKREKAVAAQNKFYSTAGDHITLLNIYRNYNNVAQKKIWCQDNFLNSRNLQYASKVRTQLSELCERCKVPMSSCGQDTEPVRKCLITGLFMNVAELQREKKYVTVGSKQVVSIHPSSVLFGSRPHCVLFTEVVQTGRCYLRQLSLIDPQWLTDIVPEYARKHRLTSYAS